MNFKKTLSQKFSFSNFSKLVLTILVLFVLACTIISPAKYISKSLDGLSAWAFNVLPSVLPFMFFTKVLSSLDTLDKLTRPLSPVCATLFKTPAISLYTFLMAILSGYPVGSKMVADLYMQGKITKQDAFRMTSFCSTSGPMFIIGAVGIGMFHNSKIGYILFISHVFGAILNGILYRNLTPKDNASNFEQQADTARTLENLTDNKKQKNSKKEKKSDKKSGGKIGIGFLHNLLKNKKKADIKNGEKIESKQNKEIIKSQNLEIKSDYKTGREKNKIQKINNQDTPSQTQDAQTINNRKTDISEIVASSTLAILNVGCIITIFFIIIECFSPILSLLPNNISYFLEGCIEITKGSLGIATLTNTFVAASLCSFVISFGGISTMLQSITMLNSVKIPMKIFALQKFTHAIFACIITMLLMVII